jgi:hypothetical protein
MKISDRFTDYGLIGGFFWLLQCAVWGTVGFPLGGWDHLFREFARDLTPFLLAIQPYIPFLAALLGALALTVVFITGLLLDLLGPAWFRTFEVAIFRENLRRNKRWLEQVIQQNQDYIQGDWSVLLDDAPRLWKNPWSEDKPYIRIQSFLLIYVFVTSGVEKIEMLNTQISLWTTSRAIAMAMLIGAIEVLAPPILHFIRDDPSISPFPYIVFFAVYTGLAAMHSLLSSALTRAFAARCLRWPILLPAEHR